MNLQPYLDFTTQLAYRAGRITLGYFNTSIRPDYKADDSPVTAADRAAEEFIRGEIEKAYPTHAIVGEEFGESKSDTKSVYKWFIDPIDGTKSFMRGIPMYAVLIGLEIDGVIQVGAAYYPGTDEMLCAADGLGTWWNGKRAHVSDVDTFERSWFCCTSHHLFEKRDPTLWKRISDAAYVMRGWSDAYAYLAVATGRAEVAIDPVMNDWDCGPFPVIFREAGGFFGSWAGEEGHTHGESIGVNAALKPKVMELIRKA
ncbi:MAG: histidinol phosphate phosphatase [Anaerolineales bacterium]|nr:histidinol phosphate phosphatase [Anaerolineales bacterium]